jgi:hypothetical protein
MLEFVLQFKDDAHFLAMLLIVAAAWRWGAGPERACASAIAFMFVVDLPYHWVFGAGAKFQSVDVGHATIDCLTFVSLGVSALYANRIYPIWLAAFQFIALISHLVRELSPTMSPLVYAIMIVAPSYLQMATLTGGLLFHVRRERRYGPYRSWRTSSPHFDRSRAQEG